MRSNLFSSDSWLVYGFSRFYAPLLYWTTLYFLGTPWLTVTVLSSMHSPLRTFVTDKTSNTPGILTTLSYHWKTRHEIQCAAPITRHTILLYKLLMSRLVPHLHTQFKTYVEEKIQLIWLSNTMTTRSLPHYQIFYWQPSRVAARSHYIRCFVLWPATGLPAAFWLVCVMKTSFIAFVSTAYLHFRLSLQDPVFLLTNWSTYILNLCCRYSRQSHCLENATRQHLQSSPKTV